MDEYQILTELGIDPGLSVAEIKQALEKKKQGLLRKLNAVFGNPTKEQELNHQLEQVEGLIIQLGLQQVIEVAGAQDERSALLSNVQSTSTVRLRDFQGETRELSQTKVEVESVSVPKTAYEQEVYQQALDKAIACMEVRDMDGAYEAIHQYDPDEYPLFYAVLGCVYETKESKYYSLEKSFYAFQRGAEENVMACYMPLVKCYRYGKGTAINHVCVIRWLIKASQEDPAVEPERMLGEFYGELGEYDEMFTWYQLGIYEHDSWQCRIDLAEAIFKYKLGTYYTEEAQEMLAYEVQQGQKTKDKVRCTLAYRALLNHYTEMEKRDTKYRKKILEVTKALALECGLPCASTVALLYQAGYTGRPDYAKAVEFYEMADANGETFDRAAYERVARAKRRGERLSHVNDRVFTAADAEELVNKTRKEHSDVLRIPEGYTRIVENAFEKYRGTGLLKKAFFSEVVLPQSLLAVERFAFSRLKGLKRYNLPPNVVEIASHAFCAEHAGAEQLTIPGELQVIHEGVFKHGVFGTVKIEEGVELIEGVAFGSATIKRLELPSSLKQISAPKEFGTFYFATIGTLRAPRALKDQIEKQTGLKLDPKNITYYD